MKVVIAAAALAFTFGAPALAGHRAPAECYSGRFLEPFCPYEAVHRGKTIIVVKQRPDVVLLPHWPYVVVNEPGG